MRLKNEVTVGVVVLLSIVILVASAFWLSGKPWGQEQRELTAVFQEVGELRVGNPVKYRGVQVGRIEEIQLAASGDGVLVDMLVAPDIELPLQTAVLIAPASLFGDWQAELISLSDQQELQFATTNQEGVLPGAALPDITELTAVGARIAEDLQTLSERVDLAFTDETALGIRQTIENIEDISQQLTGFVEQQTQTYATMGDNMLAAAQNVAEVTATVERVAGGVEQEIPLIVANARQASQNLEDLSIRIQSATAGLPTFMARADTTMQIMTDVARSVDGAITQLEPQLAEVGPLLAEARLAMATLQRAGEQLENGEGTLGRLLEDPALYEETQAAIATLRRLMADVQANPGKYIGAFKLF
jgi:phospholipid/cholesterol/gamma-HCH transport system substrate-binding protein